MKTLAKHACLGTGLALAAILLPVWAAGQEKTHGGKKDGGTPPKGQRVFYASHSLMWYAPKPLGELADAAGIKDHKLVGLQMLGASKTLQHWNLLDAKNQAKQALKKGEVDVFVMSPIQFPDEGIDNFVKLGLDGEVGAAWLKWQLKEDKEAAKMFLGDPPGLAVDKKWNVKAKNLK